jgi:hypothetical protein
MMGKNRRVRSPGNDNLGPLCVSISGWDRLNPAGSWLFSTVFPDMAVPQPNRERARIWYAPGQPTVGVSGTWNMQARCPPVP